MVIREKDTPSDKIGGLFVIDSIEGVDHNGDLGFLEKLFSLGHPNDSGHPTITVSKLDDETGRPDMMTLNERGRHPGEFTQVRHTTNTNKLTVY